MICIVNYVDNHHCFKKIIDSELKKVIDVNQLYELCKKYNLFMGYNPCDNNFTISDDWCLIF